MTENTQNDRRKPLVLITGAAGNLGGALTRRLVARGGMNRVRKPAARSRSGALPKRHHPAARNRRTVCLGGTVLSVTLGMAEKPA